ncbi:hypothetical protein ACRYK2_25205, partial [Escherichia coli]
RPDFPEPYESPSDGLRGKNEYFSHPVYLFLREFSLQDSRGGSRIAENHVYPAMIRIDYGQDFFYPTRT